MTITKTYIAKRLVSAVVGYGASRIVHQVIQNNVEPETTHELVAIKSTEYLAAYVAADVTKDYTDRKIDEIIAWFDQVKKSVEA